MRQSCYIYNFCNSHLCRVLPTNIARGINNLRIALGKFIAQDLFHIHNYWLFFIIIAISNFMKLMFFSWSYILLYLGFQKILPPYRTPQKQEAP